LEKRLPLFLFLAFLILFGWNLLFPAPPKPEDVAPPPPGVTTPVTPAPGEARAADEVAALGAEAEEELELLIGGAGDLVPESAEGTEQPGVRRGAYRARFTNRGARLLSLHLADYVTGVGFDAAQRRDQANWLPLLESVDVPGGRTGSLAWRNASPSSRELVPGSLEGALWEMERLPEPEIGVRFRYSPPGGRVVLEKKVVFEPGQWHLRVTLALENQGAGNARLVNFGFVPAAVLPAELGDRFYAEPTAVALGRAKGGDHESDHVAAPGLDEADALEVPTPLTLFGVHNKYFAFLMREARDGAGTIGGAVYAPVRELPEPPGSEPRAFVVAEGSLNLALPAEGERREWEYVVYAGPKDSEDFIADFPPHEVIVDDDLTVDAIAKGLLRVLRFFHGLVGNWGWAIILLTLCVRLVLFPLNRRSQTAMARYQSKMKRVQPQIEALKKRFEKDPQKLRAEQAALMQKEGAFPPLGGCLPMFLQIPVFFGLFSALRAAFDLRQAPFAGWIHDLAKPDQLARINFDTHLPFIGTIEYFNLLPILMVVLWVLQQRLMPKPTDEQAAKMQKIMMIMPVFMGFFLYSYAAGLSLYMITQSGMGIIEQIAIKRFWPLDATELPRKPGGFWSRMAKLQEQQSKKLAQQPARGKPRRK
jgi:YidC/Oxa1 family membrane protein insertase